MDPHRRSEEGLRFVVVASGADGVRVAVDGEVDFLTAPRLKRGLWWVLAEFDPRDLVVDLSGVSFLDSTGRGALLHGWRLAQERNCRLTVVNPQRPVLAMLRIAGVAAHLGLDAAHS
ncbi:STAS domain-containing protein [Planosporangium thailandense]|uniref:Anti-sigma factor antagonist n=1 Tax=Planosporangium thailandense TaxID=765197 RepID=A0ABX0Y471_9ACTN|nr:STAS domain-containing protein [Planosporangium thailandense]